MVTPCTDWFLVFTGMAKGNVPLSAAILPVNLVVQIALLPVFIYIYSGVTGDVSMIFLARSAVITLIAPFALAKIIKRALRAAPRATRVMELLFAKRQFVWLWLAITAMFASERILSADRLDVLARIALPVMAFFIVTFYIAKGVSRFMGFDRPDSASLMFTALARNSPLSLAFAQRAFPGNHEVFLPLIVGPLIELPILALAAQIVLSMAAKASPDAKTSPKP
jgi:ACR3 family arsenite efflux pump ArsB